MALVGVELATLVSEPDALTTRPPPCAHYALFLFFFLIFFCKKQDEHKFELNKDNFFIINTNLNLTTCTYVKAAVEGIEPQSHMAQHSTRCCVLGKSTLP